MIGFPFEVEGPTPNEAPLAPKNTLSLALFHPRVKTKIAPTKPTPHPS
jgi:hypothetical protein